MGWVRPTNKAADFLAKMEWEHWFLSFEKVPAGNMKNEIDALNPSKFATFKGIPRGVFLQSS